ncbi:hypothetical protein EVAR_62566_1 [Eumeta japonica]|uniref:Uncharacterized protein n=1 Tax=Eumeta variegata TaxID=151549 RepID=A0A4C1YQQ8_EUMVA|nr:hypothetical protein EVAR_62566_1 [Eumeta japonica]
MTRRTQPQVGARGRRRDQWPLFGGHFYVQREAGCERTITATPHYVLHSYCLLMALLIIVIHNIAIRSRENSKRQHGAVVVWQTSDAAKQTELTAGAAPTRAPPLRNKLQRLCLKGAALFITYGAGN